VSARIGLDIGVSKDRSAMSVLEGNPETGVVAILALETWEPPKGGKVDLQDVEDTVAEVATALGADVVLDPWQGMLMAQRLRTRGIQVTEYPFTAESRRKLFGQLLDLVRNGRLKARPHAALRRELLRLEVTETASGWRVDHPRGGHDDHVIAVALACSAAARDAQRPGVLVW
jgi:hypothetical protein